LYVADKAAVLLASVLLARQFRTIRTEIRRGAFYLRVSSDVLALLTGRRQDAPRAPWPCRAWQIGGDNSHGYDVVKQFRTDGEPIRGDRTINTAGAEVFGRIFHDYVVETSSKRIAAELNEDAIPAPGGGDSGFNTINGNAKCGNGILNNEMYIGRIVWMGRDDAFITTAPVLIRPGRRGAQQFDLLSSY
jgi:Recombinase